VKRKKIIFFDFQNEFVLFIIAMVGLLTSPEATRQAGVNGWPYFSWFGVAGVKGWPRFSCFYCN
jgi:hypothetical protein